MELAPFLFVLGLLLPGIWWVVVFRRELREKDQKPKRRGAGTVSNSRQHVQRQQRAVRVNRSTARTQEGPGKSSVPAIADGAPETAIGSSSFGAEPR